MPGIPGRHEGGNVSAHKHPHTDIEQWGWEELEGSEWTHPESINTGYWSAQWGVRERGH